MALSEFAKLAMQELASQINERNAAVGTLKASQGDKQGLIESLAVNPPAENKAVVALCNKVTELDAALSKAIDERNAALDPIADEMLASGKENVEALTAKVADLDKTIKAGRKYFTDLYGEEVV